MLFYYVVLTIIISFNEVIGTFGYLSVDFPLQRFTAVSKHFLLTDVNPYPISSGFIVVVYTQIPVWEFYESKSIDDLSHFCFNNQTLPRMSYVHRNTKTRRGSNRTKILGNPNAEAFFATSMEPSRQDQESRGCFLLKATRLWCHLCPLRRRNKIWK